MLFTIIVPVYKTKKELLEKCLSSLAQQKKAAKYEVLLIDDNNNADESGKICQEFAEKYENFRVFHQENGGVSQARNLGIIKAQGKYIAFVDSDDFVEENMLEIFIRESLTEADFYIFPFYFFKKEKNLHSYPDFQAEKEKIQQDILRSYFHKAFSFNVLTVWSKLYKREILIENSLFFDAEVKFGEDALFNLYFLEHVKKLNFSQKAFYNYYLENSSSTTKKTKNSIEKLEKSQEKFEEFLEKKAWSKDVIKTRILMLIFSTYILEFSHNIKESAKDYKNLVKKYEKDLASLANKDLTFQAKILAFIIKRKSLKLLDNSQKFLKFLRKIKD